MRQECPLSSGNWFPLRRHPSETGPTAPPAAAIPINDASAVLLHARRHDWIRLESRDDLAPLFFKTGAAIVPKLLMITYGVAHSSIGVL